MQSLVITLAIFVAVVLIHFSYVDFRFRYRGGIWWFWLLKPAPLSIWVSRAAIGIALLLALSTPLTGAGKAVGFLLAIFIALHITSLVLVELREP